MTSNFPTIAYGRFDVQGKLLEANQAMCRFLGTTPDELSPKYNLVNPDFKKLQQIQGDDPVVFEGMLTIGNRNTLNFSLHAKILRDGEGFQVYAEPDVMSLVEDYHKISSLNQEVYDLQRQLLKEQTRLIQTNKKLVELDKEKNKYVGMVAHDLRGPIGQMYSFSDLLIDDGESCSKEEIWEFIRLVRDRCAFSLGLINEFLDTAKIESGTFSLNMEDVAYRDLVENCISQNQLFAEKKQQQLLLQYKASRTIVHCDRGRIEQVLNNLIRNAVKYSPENKLIHIVVEADEETIQTRVIDDGLGIPEEEQKRLFTAFQTTSNRPTAGESSTGLGLAIVKKIIEAHKGTVWFNSTSGHGSEFCFELPT